MPEATMQDLSLLRCRKRGCGPQPSRKRGGNLCAHTQERHPSFSLHSHDTFLSKYSKHVRNSASGSVTTREACHPVSCRGGEGGTCSVLLLQLRGDGSVFSGLGTTLSSPPSSMSSFSTTRQSQSGRIFLKDVGKIKSFLRAVLLWSSPASCF